MSVRFRLRLHGQEIRLPQGETLIGRGDECRITLYDVLVSRVHARIVVAERAVIEDMGSRNGTWVDGRMLVGPEILQDGARIQLGRQELRLLVTADLAQTTGSMRTGCMDVGSSAPPAGPSEATAPEAGTRWQVALLLELLGKLHRTGRRLEADRVLDQLLRRLEIGEHCPLERGEVRLLQAVARDSGLTDIHARLCSSLLRHGATMDSPPAVSFEATLPNPATT